MTRRKIFIIDDSATVLDVARHALVQAGFDVETCDNPLAAARPLRKFEPDLVLIDLNMPAIKGDVVAQLLGAHIEGVPILLHSDIDIDELAERAERAGVTGYIQKTFDREVFVGQVKEWLHRARPTGAGRPL